MYKNYETMAIRPIGELSQKQLLVVKKMMALKRSLEKNEQKVAELSTKTQEAQALSAAIKDRLSELDGNLNE